MRGQPIGGLAFLTAPEPRVNSASPGTLHGNPRKQGISGAPPLKYPIYKGFQAPPSEMPDPRGLARPRPFRLRTASGGIGLTEGFARQAENQRQE